MNSCNSTGRQRNIEHIFFLLGVWSKGIAGVLETIAGCLLLWIPETALIRFVIFLTAPELLKNPTAHLALFFQRSFEQLSTHTKLFAGAYLIVHGLIKVLLVVGLLTQRLWSYPLSLWFMAAFIIYQTYRFFVTGSVWMMALTIVDLIVAILIWREYRAVLKRIYDN